MIDTSMMETCEHGRAKTMCGECWDGGVPVMRLPYEEQVRRVADEMRPALESMMKTETIEVMGLAAIAVQTLSGSTMKEPDQEG